MVVNGVFYIPSDALLPGIDKIVLKDNETFTILDSTGESPRIYDRELGFYRRDTRHLDTWELNVNGNAATALSRDSRRHARSYVFNMTNKDIVSRDYDGRIPRDRLHILRVISLDHDQVIEQVEILNYDNMPHTLEVDRRAGSRFHDIFEVRGMVREQRGRILAPTLSEDRRIVRLGYEGLDGRSYRTWIWTDPPITKAATDEYGVLISHRFKLEPRSSVTLKYVISFDQPPVPEYHGRPLVDLGIRDHLHLIGAARTTQAAGDDGTLVMPKIITNNELLNRTVSIAASDIITLLTRRGGILYPDAGIPWFCAPFGRDGIISAYQLLPWCPEIAEGVLEMVLSNLGKRHDDFTDEEPGKVFHENRFGEMAALREIPFIPYYGSVDATPLALILLGEYSAWTRQLSFANRWWEPACAAVEWIRKRIKEDPNGFLSYKAGSPRGLRNQGWKDSHDSVMHADGTLAEPPIALCEVQAYAYRALLSMARLAHLIGRTRDAETWDREAETLKRRFRDHFIDGETGNIALALDGQHRPCRVLASNMGHCLWAGLLDKGQAKKVVEHLFSDAMYSGFGIRTLATTEKAFNPLSYHNGSIWPHDNSLIAEGLRLYDCNDELVRLATALFDVAELADDFRFPELYCGFPRYGTGGPVPYDVACKPQAWAAGTPFLVLKSILGMQMHPGNDTLIFRSPLLPKQVKQLEIRGLRVCDFELDILVRQGKISSTVEVLRTTTSSNRVLIIK